MQHYTTIDIVVIFDAWKDVLLHFHIHYEICMKYDVAGNFGIKSLLIFM